MHTKTHDLGKPDSGQIAVWRQWMLDRGLYWPTLGQPPLETGQISTDTLPGDATDRDGTCMFITDYPVPASEAPLDPGESQLFAKMMDAAGIRRWQILCVESKRPEFSKTVVPQIVLRPELLATIKASNASVLVTLGDLAARALLGIPATQRVQRGAWHHPKNLTAPVLTMLHPRDLIRWPINKRETWAHLQDLAAKLQSRKIGP
jgi:uracil-DNA glycosylase family 4